MKLIEKSNYRIVVEPKTHIYGIKLTEQTAMSDLKSMEEQIKRHVDNVSSVSIEYDTNIYCSHCNRRWEVSEDNNDEDFPEGSPVCCNKAFDEWAANNQSIVTTKK